VFASQRKGNRQANGRSTPLRRSRRGSLAPAISAKLDWCGKAGSNLCRASADKALSMTAHRARYRDDPARELEPKTIKLTIGKTLGPAQSRHRASTELAQQYMIRRGS
jgi:hypothetical protein